MDFELRTTQNSKSICHSVGTKLKTSESKDVGGGAESIWTDIAIDRTRIAKWAFLQGKRR
jgi:hypothetical protein